jgi:hypothetical protein
MTEKDDLKKKIDDLEHKLLELNEMLKKDENVSIREQKKRRTDLVIGTSPIGNNLLETTREVVKAKETSEKRAGLIANTASGSTMEEDNVDAERVPLKSIHIFDNLEECLCTCHPTKQDCMKCYDHPEHLQGKRKNKTVDGYDEKRIMALIDEDKAKKEKKSWKQRLFGD